MKLSKIQEEIVNSNYNKVVVMSSAASGKTRTLTERIRFLLDKGVEPREIAVITFTNAAAAEIYERLGGKANECVIGTIHSLANRFLTKFGVDTSSFINSENFDGLFYLIEQHPNCCHSFEHLLLDEAQDSNQAQFDFILECIKPKNFMFFGDVRQSIYGFAGACPELLVDLANEEGVKVYDMIENYRNTFEILEFAKNFIWNCDFTPPDNSIAMRNAIGEIVTPAYFSFELLERYIRNHDSYKDWFVLARTNDLVDKISDFLTKKEIPNDSFKRSQLNSEQLAQKMNENTVKVLTMHSAKGLENKNVFCVGLTPYNEEERRLGYVAATRAKDRLIWCKTSNTNTKKKNTKTKITNWE